MLHKPVSRLFLRYLKTPRHPGKEVFWKHALRVLPGGRLLVPFAGRGWLAVDPSDERQQPYLEKPNLGADVWEALASFADSEEIFWDIGAQAGTHAIRAIWDPAVREAHCFEANLGMLVGLRANLDLNAGRLFSYGFDLSASARDKDKGESGASCLTIDEVIMKRLAPPPTLMRLEFAERELAVLSGGTRLFGEQPPKAIVLTTACDAGGVIRDKALREFLEALGGEIRRIETPDAVIGTRANYLIDLTSLSPPSSEAGAK